MKRRLAALLTCALLAFGQRSKAPLPPSTTTRYVDFVAVDDAGRPVTDLRPEDLEITQAGHPRTLAGLTWFDARRHAAGASGAHSFDLTPDEINRNFIAIVDDLGLSAAKIAEVRGALRSFIKDQMESGDRMAVLPVSAGDGALQQLTDDRRVLSDAIDRIQFLGGNVTERTASGATWLTLHHAIEGLEGIRGRKFIVLFSENLSATGTHDAAAGSLFSDAGAAMAAVYAIDLRDPRGPLPAAAASKTQSPLEKLTSLTGGLFGTDLAHVLQAEDSFYVAGYEEPVAEYTVVRTWDDQPLITVRRAGVTLRTRSRALTAEARQEFPAPPDFVLQVRRALLSPFAGSTIRTRLTSHFSSFAGQSAVVDASILIDAHDLSMIRDAKNVYRGSVRMMVDARADTGRVIAPVERAYDIVMPGAEYESALREGLLFTLSLRLPASGVWRVRAVTADGVSDRMGTAAQSLWIPAAGEFAISSLDVRTADPAGAKESTGNPRERSVERRFKAGQALQLLYSIFHSSADESGQARLEMRTRMYAQGHAMFVGNPLEVTYPVVPATHRQVSGRLSLARDVAPGDYILEVTVTDKLAPPGKPRTVSRFINIQLRD